MSTFRDRDLACPACGTVQRVSVAESLNVVSRPALREAIVADTFQRFACPSCSVRIAVDGPMLMLDVARKHWIELFPASWEASWHALETETLARFQQTAVQYAAPVIQEQAHEMTVRTVFGLHALREKLVAFDAGIDDRALETAKLATIAAEPSLVADPRTRIRLRGVTDSMLAFTLHEGEQTVGELAIARARLDDVAADAYRETRDSLGSAFVDMQRLLVKGLRPRPAG